MKKKVTPIEKAINIIGGCNHGKKAKAARLLDITEAYVSKMIKTGHVPVEQCSKIESLTNGQIKREELRPDIFGAVKAA